MGCVCCIFTVAFGRAGLAEPSGGSVIRAVSFFGAAARWVTGSGALDGAAAAPPGVGLSGTVGRAPREGGFGGGVMPLKGLEGGTPRLPGGFGGPGGGGALEVVASLLVSFFGAMAAAGIEASPDLPGTLIRTVSRFTAGCSLFGGKVMRIVSFFVASSGESAEAGGFSSAIILFVEVVYLTREKMCQ